MPVRTTSDDGPEPILDGAVESPLSSANNARIGESRIGFICSANMCRSPMAQAIFVAEARRRGLAVVAFSASIWDFEGEDVTVEARLTCDRHGTPLVQVTSSHHSLFDVAGATRVFVMAHKHVESLLEESTVAGERVCLLGDFDPEGRGLEIEDPIGRDEAAFDACYRRLRDCIHHYLDTTTDFAACLSHTSENRDGAG